jgi:hypothetical protein
MGCCVLLSDVSSPPPFPHLAHHFTCTRPGLSGLEGQGRPTPLPFGQFEAAAVDLEDGLYFGGRECDS